MSFENPVSRVNDFDVLLNEDVSRKSFVKDPIAYSGLERRHSRLVLTIEIIRVVVGLPESELAYFSLVNTLHQRAIAVRVAFLESDVNADLCGVTCLDHP